VIYGRIRSKAIRNAAMGEACSVCELHDETIVFAHLNHSWAGKGVHQKADDIAGFFACHKCHDIYDRRRPGRIEDWELMRAMYRTWRRLIEKGVIKIVDFDCDPE